MKKHPSQLNNQLDINELILSKNFNNIVNVIIYRLGNVDEATKKDIKQSCALAVMRSIELYDSSKNDNFWIYAMRLMTEYARNEFNLHKNIIHIPYNRINSGFKKYENVNYTYNSLTFDNGSEIPIFSFSEDICSMIDIQNAIERLSSPEIDIVKMRIGMIKTNNGKVDFKTIGDALNIPMYKARNIYLKTQKKLMKYLGSE